MKSSWSRKTHGFTLVEVMIALAIFAVVSSALIKNTSLAIKQTGMIEERTLAYWLAENELNQFRATPRTPEQFPQPTTNRQNVTMADKDWQVVTQIEVTANEDMHRVTVRVMRDDKDEFELAALSGFIGKH